MSEKEFYPTPFVCDFWAWEEPYLVQGQRVRAFVVRGNEKVYCGETWVQEGGSFLIHVYGTDGDLLGAKPGDIVHLEYEHPKYGWVEMGTISTYSWQEKASKRVILTQPGDFTGDGRLTMLDVIECGNAAFRGSGEHCDLNNDGVTNILDVVLLANVVFRGVSPRNLVWPQPRSEG